MLGINGLLKMSFAEFNGRNMYFWEKTENQQIKQTERAMLKRSERFMALMSK